MTNSQRQMFEDLVRTYSGYVYTLAWRILWNDDDARDASQETFYRVYKNLDSYDQSRDLKNWICTIALNAARDVYRTRKRYSDDIDNDDLLTDGGGSHRQTENRIFTKEVLAPLTINYRTVLVLFYLERMSVREIGSALKRPEGVIKVWLFRARKEVMKRVGEIGAFEV